MGPAAAFALDDSEETEDPKRTIQPNVAFAGTGEELPQQNNSMEIGDQKELTQPRQVSDHIDEANSQLAQSYQVLDQISKSLYQHSQCGVGDNNQCQRDQNTRQEEEYQKSVILHSLLEQLELDQPPNISRAEASQLRNIFLPLIEEEETLLDEPETEEMNSGVTEAWIHSQPGQEQPDISTGILQGYAAITFDISNAFDSGSFIVKSMDLIIHFREDIHPLSNRERLSLGLTNPFLAEVVLTKTDDQGKASMVRVRQHFGMQALNDRLISVKVDKLMAEYIEEMSTDRLTFGSNRLPEFKLNVSLKTVGARNRVEPEETSRRTLEASRMPPAASTRSQVSRRSKSSQTKATRRQSETLLNEYFILNQDRNFADMTATQKSRLPLLIVRVRPSRPSNPVGHQTLPTNICVDGLSMTCCLKKISFNFLDVGWSFVLSPQTYEGYYCHLGCGHLYRNIPHLMTNITELERRNTAKCCLPSKWRAQRLLIFLKNTLMHVRIAKMLTTECSCT